MTTLVYRTRPKQSALIDLRDAVIQPAERRNQMHTYHLKDELAVWALLTITKLSCA
jgi:hypothetical protein